MDIEFIRPEWPKSGTAIAGIAADRALSAAAAEIDGSTGGVVGRALEAQPRYTGKREEILAIPAPSGVDFGRLTLVGLGDPGRLDGLSWERIGGVLYAHLDQVGEGAATIFAEAPTGAPVSGAAAAAHLATGLRLRSYRFDKYHTKKKPEAEPSVQRVAVCCDDPDAATALFRTMDQVASGVSVTRDLVSEPANELYPESFAERCKALADDGLDVTVLDEPALEELGMGALLAVGRGSARASQVVVLRWWGAGDDGPPLAFIGKGVTFDTGGISLKPGAGMEDMKWDMGGAGAVTGLMAALARRKAPVNAVGVLGLVENMPSGTAQRPGDVVRSASGQTIEVLNTDAEGRLVLADAIWYAQEKFKPRLIVDLATLTGAIMVALGQEHAGLFSNDDTLAERLLAAGRSTGEKLWRMPLDEPYDKEIDSQIADMKNIAGNRWGGSIIGAQFIKRFVGDVPWAHLDIAGVAWTTKGSATVPKGAKGFGVRLLDRFVADNYEG